MRWKHLIGTGVISILLIGFAGFFWIWAAPCWFGGCAPLDDLAAYQAEGSELLDVNGEPFARLATVNRRIIGLDSLPPYVPAAFIAIEDRRFYSHGGLDLWRTAGALVNNVRSGRVAQGGSTITQQLARNLFPESLPYRQRNLRRKILEARVARQIERSFSKDKILELYLNHIYLGSGAYGIEAAARTYFSKAASELSLPEAATLAGVPRAPSEINPKENATRATLRRNLVLDQMLEAGFIEAAEAMAAKAQRLEVAEGGSPRDGTTGSYIVEQVRRELEERLGTNFYTGGLKVYTTLDPLAQEAAEAELERQLTAIESGAFGRYSHPSYSRGATPGDGQTPYLQGAVVVLDATTGAIRALVGGRDFEDSRFNRATQALRQPGSAFKPFIYAAALYRYGSPAHTVLDRPIRIVLPDGTAWEPRNYSDQYDGTITLRDALARSKNVATVRVAEEVGLDAAIRIARDLGIQTPIANVPAVALGAGEVRPMELTAAYAGIANGGNRVQPHLVREVIDRNGNTIWRAAPRERRALDPAVAFVLTSILRDAVDRGTGAAVRAVGFTGPAAGKTGTTTDASDVWFVGFTPELVASVWIGLDRPASIVAGASGGTLAAPVWGRLMRHIYESRPGSADWQQPSTVLAAEVDRSTASVVSDDCPAAGPVYTEYFIRSVPNPRPCPVFRPPHPLGDSTWVDEEWRLYTDSLDLDRPTLPGVLDWPELEALRRRILGTTEDAQQTESERNRDDSPPNPARDPGTPGVPTAPRPGQNVPGDRPIGDPADGQRGNQPTSTPEPLGVPAPPR